MNMENIIFLWTLVKRIVWRNIVMEIVLIVDEFLLIINAPCRCPVEWTIRNYDPREERRRLTSCDRWSRKIHRGLTLWKPKWESSRRLRISRLCSGRTKGEQIFLREHRNPAGRFFRSDDISNVYLLFGKILRTAPRDDGWVSDSVLVVLVTKHGVVWHQGEHDHVLGHDDQHQDQHGQQHSPRGGPPGPDLVEDQTAASDPDVPDPRHGAEQKEQYLERKVGGGLRELGDTNHQSV